MIFEPIRIIGISDSSLTDLKASLIGFHANQTRAATNKNSIPNGLKKCPSPSAFDQKASMPRPNIISVADILAIMARLRRRRSCMVHDLGRSIYAPKSSGFPEADYTASAELEGYGLRLPLCMGSGT